MQLHGICTLGTSKPDNFSEVLSNKLLGAWMFNLFLTQPESFRTCCRHPNELRTDAAAAGTAVKIALRRALRAHREVCTRHDQQTVRGFFRAPLRFQGSRSFLRTRPAHLHRRARFVRRVWERRLIPWAHDLPG